MKRVLFTTVALGALGLMSPAFGADLSPYIKAPAVTAPVYDWSGLYIGAFGGGGYGNHNVVTPAGLNGFANFTYNYGTSGAVAGGELGYNLQSGSFLVGVEATGFWSGIKGSDTSAAATNLANGTPFTQIDSTKLRDVVTLVARGGIAVDRLLLFFTGGWAYGDILHTNTNQFPVPGLHPVDQFSVTRSGLTAGGGIAYAITNNLIGKFEYRYFDLGAFSRANPTNGLPPYTVNNTYSVITVGLDFKFGASPVLAKY
jgi:outer membrane immunogenic protein